jgi:hypothetical protein
LSRQERLTRCSHLCRLALTSNRSEQHTLAMNEHAKEKIVVAGGVSSVFVLTCDGSERVTMIVVAKFLVEASNKALILMTWWIRRLVALV